MAHRLLTVAAWTQPLRSLTATFAFPVIRLTRKTARQQQCLTRGTH